MAYWEDGYAQDQYVEGDVVTNTPSLISTFSSSSFLLDGIDISEFITNCSIDKSVNRAYHVASLSISGYIIDKTFIKNPNILLTITIDTDVYSCIIFTSNGDFNKNYEVIAKTQQCLLEAPFSSKKYRSYRGNSKEILAQISLDSGIHIADNSSSFDFNVGEFAIEGSEIDAIVKLCETTGADYYAVDDSLHIEKSMHILQNSNAHISINTDANIVTEYTKSDNSEGFNSVTSVRLNPKFADIYSTPKITLLEEACNRKYFLFNPRPIASQIRANIGEFDLGSKMDTVEINLEDSRTIVVDGGIDSVSIVSVNGVEVAYSFEDGYNVILLDVAISGVCKVVYFTTAIVYYRFNGQIDTTTRKWTFDISYLNQNLVTEASGCGGSKNTAVEQSSTSADNKCNITISENPRKDTDTIISITKGATLPTIVGIQNESASISNIAHNDITLKKQGAFDSLFMENITIGIGTRDRAMSLPIEQLTPTLVGFRLDVNLTPTQIKVGNTTPIFANYGKFGSVNYWTVDSSLYVGQTVQFIVEEDIDIITIPAPSLSNSIKFFNVYGCDGITTIKYPDPNSSETDDDGVLLSQNGSQIESCILPLTISIDVAGLTKRSPATVSGKSVTCSTISLSATSWIVNSFGEITIVIDKADNHILLCDSIFPDQKIFINNPNMTGGV